MSPHWRPLAVAISLIIPVTVVHAQAADGFFDRKSPNALRPILIPPKNVWDTALENVNSRGKRLGYTFEEMLGYPNWPYRLRSIENCFRDILAVPEFAGLFSDNLINGAKDPYQLSFLCWNQLDARTGRDWAVPTAIDDWNTPGVPKGTAPMAALEQAITRSYAQTSQGFRPLNAEQKRAITAYGVGVPRLLARLIFAAHYSEPFLRAAYRSDVIKMAQPRGSSAPTRKQLWDMLVAPYLGDVNDDTIAISNRGSYEAMRTFDANMSSFAANAYFRQVQFALDEYEKWASLQGMAPSAPSVRFETGCGTVVLGGTGRTTHSGTQFLIVDLGGDDRYSGLIGSSSGPEQPISTVIDFGGNDVYDGRGIDGNVGCGMLGIGAIFDYSGDDDYLVQNGGIGFGLYGTGLVMDRTGDDEYRCKKGWAQGAAYAGVGVLADHDGADKYESICMSMGFGGTFGIGAMIDLTGNDKYWTANVGNPSKAWGGRTVSMSLGCGYGRRADSGDGQNQGGGIGAAIDVAGDDSYHTSIFSLGSGYWWGFGIFEDRAGNDTYRCTHYCAGSGAHFAIGSFVDLAGNDKYNDRADAVERWAAIGRDGSMATCYDGGGDDVWGNLTGGHADLNSVALFWERDGNDVYKRMQPFDPAQTGNRPYGTATVYPPLRNFRDLLTSAGIFLDTAGKDVYAEGMTAADNAKWNISKGPISWGFGWDGELLGADSP